MTENISIKEIDRRGMTEALTLDYKVFDEYEAPDYTQEGVDEFHKSICAPEYLSQLYVLGAFDGEKLIGVIAARNQLSHIALFFVDGEYHRQGIGKDLFLRLLEACPSDIITVNSSPYAVPVYHKLGFCDTNSEQVVKGIRFTPMEFRK